MTSWHLLF